MDNKAIGVLTRKNNKTAYYIITRQKIMHIVSASKQNKHIRLAQWMRTECILHVDLE